MSTNINFDMAAIVSKMTPSKDLKKFLDANRGAFVDFGKKNSHILRAKLEKIMEKEELPKDSQFMLHFFAALMKRKNRMIMGLDKMSDEIKDLDWYEPLYNFVTDNCVDFPDEEDSDSFALIHLPATNPPLILLCWVLASKREDVTYENFLSQQVSAQINLSEEVQAEQKEVMRKFWEETVTRTSRAKFQKEFEKKRNSGNAFDEQIYKNQENDKYLLLNKTFRTVRPTDMTEGYTKHEILTWLASFFKGAGKKVSEEKRKAEEKEEDE